MGNFWLGFSAGAMFIILVFGLIAICTPRKCGGYDAAKNGPPIDKTNPPIGFGGTGKIPKPPQAVKVPLVDPRKPPNKQSK